MNRASPYSDTSTGLRGGSLPYQDAAEAMQDMRNQVSKYADEAGKQALSLAGEVKNVATRHPFATIAVAAGLAFTIGALWKLNQPRSRFDDLWDRLPNRSDLMGRRWR